jgi:RecB family exonuclease
MNRPLPLLPSASKSDLAALCAFPWNGGKRWPAYVERPEQRFGKAFHAIAEAIARALQDVGEIVSDLDVGVTWAAEMFGLGAKEREQLQAMAQRILELLASDDAVWRMPEPIYAVNVETLAVRVLEDRRDRRPSERIAIADLVFMRADGRLVVREYKTGRAARTKRAGEAAQTRLLGYAAARALGHDSVRVEFVHVEPERLLLDGVDLDELDFCVVEGQQAELVDRLRAPPAPNPGPWCEQGYCPIQATCPATQAMVTRVEQEVLRVPFVREPQTPEEAGALRAAVQLVRAWADEAETRWKAMASRGPIPAGPGLVVVAQERQGDEELTDSDEVLQVITDEVGALVVDGDEARRAEAQRASYTVKVSKASIERAIRKALGARPARGALGRAQGRILDRLRAAGHIRRGGRYVVFTEMRADQLGRGAIDAPAEPTGGET